MNYEIYFPGEGKRFVTGLGFVEKGKWVALTDEQVASFEELTGGKLTVSGFTIRKQEPAPVQKPPTIKKPVTNIKKTPIRRERDNG